MASDSDFFPILIFLGVILFIVAIFGITFYLEKKRRDELSAAARRMGFSFNPGPDGSVLYSASGFDIFKRGHSQAVSNVMAGETDGIKLTIFDYKYTVGYGKHSSTYSQTVTVAEVPNAVLPKFSLGPESIFHKIGEIVGFKDIDFPGNKGFSDKYLLKGSDEAAVRAVFKPETMRFFESMKDVLNVEAEGGRMAIYRMSKHVKPEDISKFAGDAARIARMFVNDRGIF